MVNNIPDQSIYFIFSWCVFLILSLVLYFKKLTYWKFSLFVAAFSLASAFALFSPFLYTWDEQFHALVAKNALTNPFHPKLLPNNPIDHQSDGWLLTSTWLHKQPLFTWLMALSMKLFGISVYSVRLPSIIAHAVLTLVVFRIGELVYSKKVGIITALLFMHSSYLLGLISGRIGTDHNDYIFMSFIGLSFWAYFEWRKTALKKWLIWIGVFVGCAVLTKWLVGLLVFFGWGILFLNEWIKHNDNTQFKPIVKSFFISLIIFVPWQIYTFLAFPISAKREMAYNSLHLWHAVEGHNGNLFFHYDKLTELYFFKVDFLIFFLVSVSFLIAKKDMRKTSFYLISSVLVVYLFFTLVETKMPSFTVCVMPLVFVILAFGMVRMSELIRKLWLQKVFLILITLMMTNFLLKPMSTLVQYGFKENTLEQTRMNNMTAQLNFILNNKNPKKIRIVFGAELEGSAFASWMFFTNDIAYPFYPDKKTVGHLLQNGFEVLLIDNNNSIPEELKNDARIKTLKYH